MATEPTIIQFSEVTAAADRIKNGVKETPLEESPQLSKQLGMTIFFKKEFRLPTGSFKERGARNTLELLSEEQKKKGVIAASAGNHALALAYHGHLLNVPVFVVTPENAPIMKVSRCETYGARVEHFGANLAEAKEHAMKRAKEEELEYVNGYDDPRILAGQGTAAKEVIEQMDRRGVTLDAVVIPVGGGGLLAGMAVTLKELCPDVQVIAVESEKCASFSEALKAGRPVRIEESQPSLADGLAVPKVGGNAFATAVGKVDHVCIVEEDKIELSILRLVEIEKCVIEGAGACGVAACLSGKLDERLKGKNVVVMLSGGNIDTTVLGRCLERGLATDGRLVRFNVQLQDIPGTLAELTKRLGDLKVSVKDIIHERTWLRSSTFGVELGCVCETRGKEHSEELRKELEKHYGDRLLWCGKSVEGQPGHIP